MALPFIVGPHQCSLTHGPDGRPQVEIVLRMRLPLAEFFDALLLSLADQRPLFQQSGYGTAQAGQSGTTDSWSHWPHAERGGPPVLEGSQLCPAKEVSSRSAIASSQARSQSGPNS